YKTIELVTLAQACVGQFGLDSRMAAAINEGKDLHRLVAARVLKKSEPEVTDAERASAKPINFGKPGGMGTDTLVSYAKVNYGVRLTTAEAEKFSKAWLQLFPEMEDFLEDTVDVPLELAGLLGLTPSSHHEHTGSRKFLDHPDNSGKKDRPHRLL